MVNKSAFFNKFKEFMDSDGIELIKYKNGESLTQSDYSSLFKAFIYALIGVCVEEQEVVSIDGLCEAGFDIKNQKFVITVSDDIQKKLTDNQSVIQNNLLIPVTNEDVFYMLNESKISEVFL